MTMDGKNVADFQLSADQLGLHALCLRADEELTIVYASSAFYTMLGYRENEITALRKPKPGCILGENTPVDWDMARRASREIGFAEVELKLIKKDGHHIWVSYRMKTVVREEREYFSGLVADITLARRFRRIQREQKEELEALTANVPGGVLRCRADEGLTLTFISEGFRRLTGYSAQEIAERFQNRLLGLVYPQDRSLLLQQIRSGRQWDDIMEYSFRIVKKSGDVIWTMSKARCMIVPGSDNLIYGVMIDITERKKAQEELLASEERYRLILEHVTEPVFDCNFETGEIYYSPAFQQTFEFTDIRPKASNFIQTLSQTNVVADEDRKTLLEYCAKLLNGETVGNTECRLRARNGEYIWCALHPYLFCNSLGRPTRLIAMIQDIDRQKKETLALKQEAEHDLLTGLYNRITTMKLVNEAIAVSSQKRRHALFVIDIDNFKDVNDCLGHLSGDKLIMDTAEQIRSQFRGQDVIGRIGGDEFVIFMKDIDADQILKKADVLNRMFAALHCAEEIGHPLSGSIGVSFYPEDGRTYDELFRKADAAMYTAKNSGKNSFRVYVKGMEITMQAKLRSGHSFK